MTARRTRLMVAVATGGVMVIGLITSGVANRLVFVPWALLTVGVFLGLLHLGLRAAWPVPLVLGAAALGLAVAFAAYAMLVGRHQQAFDEGMRAFLPALHHPLATRPAFGYGVSSGLGLLGLLSILLGAPMRRNAGPRRRVRADHDEPTSTTIPTEPEG